MKKFLLILTIFFNALAIQAQEGDPKADGGKIEAYKIAFLTKKLNLSPEEAQRFWPIYNKYADEIRQARIENRRTNGPEIAIEERILNIRKKYNGEFGKALSTEKVNKFFRAEKEFGSHVQKELLERRNQRMDNRKRTKQ